jgi:hypothetical protein
MSRLTIEQVENLPTKRIISYLKTFRSSRYSFICGCCHTHLSEFEKDGSPEQQRILDEEKAINEYTEAVYKVLNSRKDRKSIESNNFKKTKDYSSKNKKKGCQKKTKSKKKTIKDSLHWSNKGAEKHNSKKKAAVHSVSKDIDKMSSTDVWWATGFSINQLNGDKL